ncbi:glycylpeptide N-tetradecanoyltransferas-like protein [Periconia macrospinosa]|uniref:Glycylpeptide N-tetradecanoyltransferase n=1 Tax=Periconia macrospinosa TaxID=97972 RepID=A0A2V1DI66_9PLEO|nr:glycylpeptide N-tetradecanoyltransferas-like protein [Periconia macrospinosa]
MPQQGSKIVDHDETAEGAPEAVAEASAQGQQQDAHDSEDDSGEEATEAVEGAEGATQKKKKSRRKKVKEALTGSSSKTPEIASTDAPASQHLSNDQLNMLLEANPALKNELMSKSQGKADLQKLLRSLNINEMMTGLSAGGKNAKDMASYTFWKTQPVPSFEEMAAGKDTIVDGPIKEIDIECVPKEPSPLLEGFEWVTMDLEDSKQIDEVYDLLYNHYVEDQEAMFRFRYSPSFLDWALKAPGWKKDWHVGIRASKSGKLVAFISGIPVRLRVRERVLESSEINFLCVHKKLRSKRLAPVLIKEITRRCYVDGIFQAVYTVGSLLPTPVSTCRYFHRSINWEKLYDVKFSPLPHGSTKQRQIIRYKLPDQTSTPGLREMEAKDIDTVVDLLQRYLKRMDLAQEFSTEEFKHWMFPTEKPKEQVVWTYVVEDPSTKKVTDFFSFYNLESTVIGHKKHESIKAAYLFYYATETAFTGKEDALKTRLNSLIKDALILAKKADFDVFNALTLLDNPYFLEEQRFGAGDGSLHYYLYNYRAAPLPGGIDARNQPSVKQTGGVGLVML